MFLDLLLAVSVLFPPLDRSRVHFVFMRATARRSRAPGFRAPSTSHGIALVTCHMPYVTFIDRYRYVYNYICTYSVYISDLPAHTASRCSVRLCLCSEQASFE